MIKNSKEEFKERLNNIKEKCIHHQNLRENRLYQELEEALDNEENILSHKSDQNGEQKGLFLTKEKKVKLQDKSK